MYITVQVLWNNSNSGSLKPCNYIARLQCVKLLVLGQSECDFKNANATVNLVLLIGIYRSSFAIRWLLRDLTDDKSTLIQVMAWCRQAASYVTWANVDPDLCCHRALLGHNGLNWMVIYFWGIGFVKGQFSLRLFITNLTHWLLASKCGSNLRNVISNPL